MRRQLLASTFAIALVCVVILGVPLALLARHEVWTSARDRLREEATSLGTTIEDRLDTHRALDLNRYLTVLHNRHITVRAPHIAKTEAGPVIDHPLSATVVVADATVTVEQARAPIVARARELTALVFGLGALAIAAAVALALWQARRLARPLAVLATRADELGRGEFAAEPLRSGVPEIDQVSAQLERSAHEIGAFIDLLQQLATDAAHQLRTPLTSIGLHLDEIGRVGGPDVQAEAEDALAQVQRLNDVIGSLLARARRDAAEPEPLDLVQLVADGTSPWRRVLTQAGRSLQLDVPGPIAVRARREHVLGVLTSLLDNAVMHGQGAVHVAVRADDGVAVVRVSDGGPGVSAELRPSVFDRQISGGSGTGIGLALARSLAAAESGTLILSPDDPAEFVFTLPAAAPPAAAAG